MEEALFDLSDEYRQMLHQGLRLSGESQEFFIRGRIESLESRLPADFAAAASSISAAASARRPGTWQKGFLRLKLWESIPARTHWIMRGSITDQTACALQAWLGSRRTATSICATSMAFPSH